MLVNRHEIKNRYSEDARIVMFEGETNNYIATLPDSLVKLMSRAAPSGPPMCTWCGPPVAAWCKPPMGGLI